MKIKKIYPNQIINVNHKITHITDNSKNIIQGSIFVAIKGYNQNGEDYIEEAIYKGAITIIVQKDFKEQNINSKFLPKINIIKVLDPKKELALLLKQLYHQKIKKFKFIGVTGTNGKTTTCTLLYRYLRLCNFNTICFTSNGNYINDSFESTKNTTPNITIIYDTIIKSQLKKGIVILEVSSQAISELRICGFEFDIVGITNITTDHLDYHKNISDYFYTKARLLYQLKEEGILLINHNSPYFLKLQSMVNNPVYSYGEDKNSDFKWEIVESKVDKTLFLISENDNINPLETTLIGQFNIQNITLVFAILKTLNINTSEFATFIKNIKPIMGRMNIYDLANRIIIIDYAHTIDAVKSSLQAINNFKQRKIKLVIGCGGNRDRLKRPVIGQLACLYADFVYFTEDNSRNENRIKILKEITCDLTTNNYMIIESRKEAIKKAVIDSKPQDIIVLMGMGCEKTIVDGKEYTDLEMIKKSFKEFKGE